MNVSALINSAICFHSKEGSDDQGLQKGNGEWGRLPHPEILHDWLSSSIVSFAKVNIFYIGN